MTDQSEPGEGSTKPYLLRAIYEWAIDHRLTPQILVDAGVAGVVVPMNCVKDGRLVLTIHPQSVEDLQMGNEWLQFSARFSGKPFAVCVPVTAVSAIYCRENGRGVVFQGADGDQKVTPEKPTLKKPAAPHLKLVK